MLESYKYSIEFSASEDAYEKIVKLIKEVAPDSHFKIKVEREEIIYFSAALNEKGNY